MFLSTMTVKRPRRLRKRAGGEGVEALDFLRVSHLGRVVVTLWIFFQGIVDLGFRRSTH